MVKKDNLKWLDFLARRLEKYRENALRAKNVTQSEEIVTIMALLKYSLTTLSII